MMAVVECMSRAYRLLPLSPTTMLMSLLMLVATVLGWGLLEAFCGSRSDESGSYLLVVEWCGKQHSTNLEKCRPFTIPEGEPEIP